MTLTHRNRSILLGVAVVSCLIVAAMATQLARDMYLKRASLLLEPTFVASFAAANARLPNPPTLPRIVFFGDSRVRDWTPAPAVKGFELTWRGIDGETTAQMLYRYRNDTERIGASIVVIQAGINDLVAGTALGKPFQAVDPVFRNLRSMVDSSTRAGVRVILLTVVPPATPPLPRRIVWSDSIYPAVTELNKRVLTLAGPHVEVIDAAHELCGAADRMPPELARDTLHFRRPAYDLLNRALLRLLMDSPHAVQ